MTPTPELLELPEVVLDFSALDRLPTDQDLPSDDGEPLETFWHRLAIGLLVESIESHWRGRKDFFVGGNMFMYFSKERVFNKDFRGPDFFVVIGADHDKKRDSWVYWQEAGCHPNVIIELSSESTADTDRVEKKQVYSKKLRVAEYLIYDPRDDSLVGWRLRGSSYRDSLPIEPETRIWSEELDLFVGPWDGTYLGHTRRWLRFFDGDGKLVPTFAEAETAARIADAARADTEAARANAEAAARIAAEAKAHAAEVELARLKQELEALRGKQPPTAP